MLHLNALPGKGRACWLPADNGMPFGLRNVPPPRPFHGLNVTPGILKPRADWKVAQEHVMLRNGDKSQQWDATAWRAKAQCFLYPLCQLD